jgi:hypothetical protein
MAEDTTRRMCSSLHVKRSTLLGINFRAIKEKKKILGQHKLDAKRSVANAEHNLDAMRSVATVALIDEPRLPLP